MKTILMYIGALGTFLCGTLLIMSSEIEEEISSYHEQGFYSTGAPAGKTGAPGDGTCTDCHSGSAQDGNNGVNLLTLDAGGTNFIGGSINSMTLELTDPGTVSGFQLIALNSNDEMAGSFSITDATNTEKVSGAQREYVTHTGTGTSSSQWSFDWNAPTDDSDVTFYVATNKADGLSGNNGDVIYLSSHDFSNPQASVQEDSQNFKLMFKAGYSPTEHLIHLDFSTDEKSKVAVNVINLSGQSVYFNQVGNYLPGSFSEKLKLPENIRDGIYSVTLFLNNRPYTKKILIQR